MMEPVTDYDFGAASGYTESRLDEVLPYNFTGDYSTISGLTVFDSDWVRYTLDGVTYETNTNSPNQLTRFFLVYDPGRDRANNFHDAPLIHVNRQEVHAPTDIKNGVNFERPAYSALKIHQKLSCLRNMGMVSRFLS